jgi:Protein of unknown function (DUF2878)
MRERQGNATLRRKLFNFAGLQLGWYACALGAARGRPWIGLVTVGVYLVVHVCWSPDRWRELALIARVGLLGTAIDSFQKQTGLLAYASDAAPSWLCPLWITALWALFGSSLTTSLGWLRDRYGLAALLGAVFGPLSFMAGARLNAVTFPRGPLSAIALALVWGSVMPLLVWMAKRNE